MTQMARIALLSVESVSSVAHKNVFILDVAAAHRVTSAHRGCVRSISRSGWKVGERLDVRCGFYLRTAAAGRGRHSRGPEENPGIGNSCYALAGYRVMTT